MQYPDALPTMSLDLNNIRLAAAFLSKTEINFDLVSAVDELAAQVSVLHWLLLLAAVIGWQLDVHCTAGTCMAAWLVLLHHVTLSMRCLVDTADQHSAA